MSFSFGSSSRLLGDAVLLAVACDARVPPAAGRDVTAVPGGVRGSALLGTAVTQGAGFLSCRSEARAFGLCSRGEVAGARPTVVGQRGLAWQLVGAPPPLPPPSIGYLGARLSSGLALGRGFSGAGPVCVRFLGYFSLFLVPWRVPSLISRSLFMLSSNFFCCS